MSPTEQRVAIAEALGWRVEPSRIQRGYNLITPDGKLWDSFWDNEVKGKTPAVADRWMNVPDYLADINAMHEAEESLTYEQLAEMEQHLDRMERGYVGSFHATAAQRAEAFLKTLNLWKPEPDALISQRRKS